MQNLSLDDLVINNFHTDLSDVQKVLRRGTQTAMLTFENVYFRHESIKLNKYPVKYAEWLQVANMIFMQTTDKFEWYDVSKEIKTSINLLEGFLRCSWNPSQTVLTVLYVDGSVQLFAVDLITYQLILLEKCDKSCDIQISDSTNNNSIIVWNKEGDAFVVGYAKNDKIDFNVYTDKCQLFAKGECEDVHLLPVFAWSSDGCLIGALEENEGKIFVRFFEKNGIKKDLLPIPHPESKMERCSFEWNSSGDLFAVMFVDTTGKSLLWLYSHDNYQWQVKKSLHLPNYYFQSFQWLPAEGNSHSLKLITETNELFYRFSWSVDVSYQYLAMIDGNSLRLTHIENQIKPAPLSTISYKYPNVINEVKFSPAGEFMTVLLSDNTIYITDFKNNKLNKINLENLIEMDQRVPLCLNNCIIDDNMDLYLVHNFKNKQFVYCINKLNNGEIYGKNVKIMHESENRITQLYLSSNKLIIKTVESIIVYDKSIFTYLETKPFTFPSQVTALEVNNIMHIFTLNDNKFYCDDNVVMDNVTSYLIYAPYVMLTTINDMLICFDLSCNDHIKVRSQMQTTPLYERLIPKAAKLICYLPYSSSIVLQLKRGDFEIIKPRILSIRLVRKLLIELEYAKACNIVKYDRLNTDVLVDLEYEMFMSNIEYFVRSFEQCDFLNVFITGLQDENVVNRLYKNCITEQVKKIENKKQTVLKQLIETMERIDRVKYLSPIITARIMLNQFEETLLDLNWALKQNTINVDAIFDSVIPLINPEMLLNAALSLQQFDMVQWVANKTQMDPLEYMPFINELADMNPNYRSYKINIHLKRYGSAFESLIKCNDNVEDEIMHLIDTHDLSRFAIRITKPDNKWYEKIINKCAETLTNRKINTEAGFLYKKIKMFDKALDCFVNGANLNEFKNLSEWVKNKGISISMRPYHQRLVKKLIETGKVKEASQVYELLDNYEEGISLLINHNLWTESFYYIAKHNRYDMIVSDFHPAISTYSSELCQQFLQKCDQFNKFCSRLEVIRTDKLNMLTLNGTRDMSNGFSSIGFNETEDVQNADIESLLSVLSVTTKTAVTNTSSSTVTRKKKKLARKTLEVREGGVFENIALIRQLHVIATELYGYANIVNETCNSLMGLNENTAMDSAARLHSTYTESLNKVTGQIDKIWPEDFINPPRPLNAQAAVLRLNIEHLEPQFRFPPESPSTEWVVYSLT